MNFPAPDKSHKTHNAAEDVEDGVRGEPMNTLKEIERLENSILDQEFGAKGKLLPCKQCRDDPTIAAIADEEAEQLYSTDHLAVHQKSHVHSKRSQLLRWFGCIYLPSMTPGVGPVGIESKLDRTVRKLPKWKDAKCPWCKDHKFPKKSLSATVLDHLDKKHRDRIPSDYHIALDVHSGKVAPDVDSEDSGAEAGEPDDRLDNVAHQAVPIEPLPRDVLEAVMADYKPVLLEFGRRLIANGFFDLDYLRQQIKAPPKAARQAIAKRKPLDIPTPTQPPAKKRNLNS